MKTNFSTINRLLIGLFIIFIVYPSNKVFAQWREVYKGNSHDNNIVDISFVTPATGFVAFSDFVGFTSDSGRTFAKRYISYGNIDFNGYIGVNLTFGFNPSGIKTFSSDSLLVYGDFGTEPSILFSANQGVSWKLVYHEPYSLTAPVLNEGITDIEFPGNTNIGYAVHHERILKTSNRGQSWYAILNTPNQQLKKLSFPSLNVGFVAGGNKVYKTANGGSSWITVSPDVISTNPVYDNIFFTTDLNGFITQSFGNKIFNTKDGGTTWRQMNDASIDGVYGSDMYFINDSTGYVAGTNGYDVSKTSDSGKTWELCVRNTNYQYLYYGLNTISFLSDKKTGWAGGQGEYLMITTNGATQTIPHAYFKVDTTGVSKTGNVNLINYSKKVYTYKWMVNKQVVSTSYNASYNHDKYKSADTIQLIVSNGIYNDTTQVISYFVPQQPPLTYTGWKVKHTNIPDNLIDIRFFGDNGLIIGTKGMYYTKTGIDDTTGWKKFKIIMAQSDSISFERTKFTALAFGDKEPLFYACGNDTINNSAVIIAIDLNTMKGTFVYKGNSGTHLNAIHFLDPLYLGLKGNLLAVGNGGLEVLYNSDTKTATASYLTDKRNLINIFRRFSANLNDAIGILSDSVIYAASLENGSVAYSQSLSTKVIAGTNLTNYTDEVISKSTLHWYFNASSYFVSDSITNIKPLAVTYNCITTAALYSNAMIYVGTNNGIYRVIGKQAIEYMPTSEHLAVNKIWFKQQPALDTGYAVGNNGIILKTDNFGGPDVPYSRINVSGNCIGDNTYLNGIHGTGNTCAWYIDNAFLANNCNGFNTVIAGEGEHQVKYVVSNEYGLADTSIENIFISPVPRTDITFDVNDTILCKSESVLIKIDNTQMGFRYTLVQDSTESLFGSVSGNGGTIYLKTNPIFQTGDYFIRVNSENSGCSRDFTKKIHIIVEHTKSLFTGDLYNALPGENVNFFSHSLEAGIYHWTFNQDASIQTSTSSNVLNVHYASAGNKTLSLVSESINGCADTLTASAVVVYEKPVPDDVCFDYTSLNYDPDRGISSLSKLCLTSGDGYVITGEGSTPIVQSRYGISPDISNGNTYIPYVAKYSTDGVLKWLVYNPSGGNLFNAATDQSGNIYVTGGCTSNTYFHFPNGDSARIASDTTKYELIGFLMKLTPAGKLIWVSTFEGLYSTRLSSRIAVKNNTILLTGGFNANVTYTKDGQTQDVISLNPCGTCEYQNNFLLKIKDDGALLWHTYFENGATNWLYDISGAAFDKNGNVYISGYYEDQVIIHSTNSNSITLHGNVAYAKGYLLQFDNNGILKWNVDMQNADVEPDALVADDQGNSYVTGSSGNNIKIVNSDGSQNVLAAATYFLMKFSPSGKYLWGAGSQSDYVSSTHALQLKNNDVYTGGYISSRDVSSATYNFTSTAGNPLQIDLAESEFFVAQYGTNGTLKRIVGSGVNRGGHLYVGDIILDSKNNFIISGTTDDENGGTGTFKIFNRKIQSPRANDFIVKTDFNFCNSDIVLPVNIISFNGYLNNNDALLNWKVADEVNVDHYNIQRSTDGRNFSTIGSVTALNKIGQNSYVFTDDLAETHINVKQIYYRIEVTDKDGHLSYTNTIVITLSVYSINAYPNPNNGKFKLEVNTNNLSNSYYILITDIAGKKLFEKSILNGNSYSKNYDFNLSAGTYFIEVNDGTNKTIKKLVICK